MKPSDFSIAPGAIPTTLIFLGPNSTAKCLVKASIPALAVPACDYNATPQWGNVVLILIITPPLLDIHFATTALQHYIE